MRKKSLASTVADSPRHAKRKRVSLAPTECSDRTVVYEGGAISSPRDFKMIDLLEANVAASKEKLKEKNRFNNNQAQVCHNAEAEKSRPKKKQMGETPRQECNKYAEENGNKKREYTHKAPTDPPSAPLKDKQPAQAAHVRRCGSMPIYQGQVEEGEENRMEADPTKNARKRERASTPPPTSRRRQLGAWKRNDLSITIPKTEFSMSSCPPSKRSRAKSVASTVVVTSPMANASTPWEYDEILAHCSNTADSVAEQLRGNDSPISEEKEKKKISSSNNGGSTTTGSGTRSTVNNNVSPTSGNGCSQSSPSAKKKEMNVVVAVELTQKMLQELNYSQRGDDDDRSSKSGDNGRKTPHMINRMKQEGQIANRFDCSMPKEEVKDQVKEQGKRPKSLPKTLVLDLEDAPTPKEQHRTAPRKVRDFVDASTPKEQHKTAPRKVQDFVDASTPTTSRKVWQKWVRHKTPSPRIVEVDVIEID